MRAALALLWLAAAGPALQTKATLPGGARLEIAYDFNRNAIEESVEADGARFVARTRTGNLELFGEGGRKLLAVRVPPTRALCLGRGRGGVLVGFADGTVARLDLATLQPVTLARLQAPVFLVGERPGGGVVAVSERSDPKERAKRRMHEVTSEVHVIGGPTVVVPHRPRRLLIDGADRAWLGTNTGEWGGGVEVISLADRKTRELVVPDHSDVDGFLERPDGAIWAYGGGDNFGPGRSFVARVDGAEAVTLFQGAAPPLRPRPDAGPPLSGPGGEIFHLLAIGQTLVAVTHDRIFAVEDHFTSWHALFQARPRPWPQLPEPVSMWPSLSTVHVRGPGKFLLATEREGYLSIVDGKEAALGVPHQLGLDRIRTIVPVGRDVFFYWTNEEPPWHPIADGYAPVDPAAAKDPIAAGNHGWRNHTVVPAPGGKLVSFAQTFDSDGHGGSLTMTRWRGGRAETTIELPAENVERRFFTPDGELWKVSGRQLYRLVDDQWQSGQLDLDPRQWLGVMMAEVLRTSGPEYWVHDQIGKRLYRLVRTPALGEGAMPARAKMSFVDVRADGAPLDVLAAEPFGKSLLLATPKGLRLLLGDAQPRVALAPASFALPADAAITRLAHDGRGRLWLGGRGLWVVTDQESAPLSVNEQLPVRDGTVEALGRNPVDADEMIVSLQDRGLLNVRLRDRR